MHGSVDAAAAVGQAVPGVIPPSPVTAVTVPDNRFTLEGHDLVMVESATATPTTTACCTSRIWGWSLPGT